jgi:hypothetical protein
MTRFQITILVLLVLICFSSSTSSVAEGHSVLQARIPTVQLCELLRSPGRYRNVIVRLQAVYLSWFEGSELITDCPHSEGGVWAYFPESAYSQSKREIAERLEDIFFRHLPAAKQESDTMFNRFETDMTVTGKISQSKKRTFGIHGGFAYLFTIETVEKIGSTRIYDLQGNKTDYISESSDQRQARHAKEVELVCEANSLALRQVLTEFESREEQITLEANLGRSEHSPNLNRDRLAAVRDYFINCAGVPKERIIIREGNRSRFEGRVNVYRAGKLSKILLAGTDMNLCLKPCSSLAPNTSLDRSTDESGCFASNLKLR